jgi:hypothetical protein
MPLFVQKSNHEEYHNYTQNQSGQSWCVLQKQFLKKPGKPPILFSLTACLHFSKNQASSLTG